MSRQDETRIDAPDPADATCEAEAGLEGDDSEAADAAAVNTEIRVRDLTIINRRGLHARASAKFVKCVEAFDTDISVSKDGHVVDGASIMGLMMLAAQPGCIIRVAASGRQADDALAAIATLVDNAFDEED